MKEQVLSIEQMLELEELDIDISKASMCYLVIRDHLIGEESTYVVESDSFLTTYLNESNNISIKDTKYTFTLQDILLMLPTHKTFSEHYSNDKRFGRYWIRLVSLENDNIHTELSNESLLDAAFNMLKWCKQNNYI